MKAKTVPTPACDACKDMQATYRLLALTGLNLARQELDRIARGTDSPAWRDIMAADYLDAAHDLLARVLP